MSRGSATFKTMDFSGGIVTNAYEGDIVVKRDPYVWGVSKQGNPLELTAGQERAHEHNKKTKWEGVGRKQTAKPDPKIMSRKFGAPSVVNQPAKGSTSSMSGAVKQGGKKAIPGKTKLARVIDKLSPHQGKLAALGLASAIGATAYGIHQGRKHATKGFTGEDLNSCFD